LTDFQKILKYQISRISVQWELSCSMQTDMTKQTVALHTFVKAPKDLSSGLGIDTTRSQTRKKKMHLHEVLSFYFVKNINMVLGL